MAFVNFSVLAFGSLLMGVPILLHLLMKQQPRRQMFPAMRFLRQRQVANQRRLQLRHWLLLALRMALVAFLAALLSRPSVDSVGLGYWLKTLLLGIVTPLAIVTATHCWLQRKGAMISWVATAISLLLLASLLYHAVLAMTVGSQANVGNSQSPVAAVLVFDTSPRMGLLHENRTRLEEAQSLASELIAQLPPDSEVAVVDAMASVTTFSLDRATAANMISSLQVMGHEFPLHQLVQRGIELVAARNDKRKEVYVLSDLSLQVWQASLFRAAKARLTELPEVSLFVLDVGVELPRNRQLGPLRLASDSVARGQSVRIETDISALHTPGEVAVEVWVEKSDPTRPVLVDGQVLLPESTQRDRATANLASAAGSGEPSDSSAVPTTVSLSFELAALPPGLHHGYVRIGAEDGLAVDNIRYFTVEVRPPWPVLLATSPGAEFRYVEEAISPMEQRQRGEAPFECTVLAAEELINRPLSDFAIIAMLDPLPLTPSHWRDVRRFVEAGGGLALFLGRNAQPPGRKLEDFNRSAAELLPAPLRLQWRTGPDDYLFVSPGIASHAILQPFRGRESLIPWDGSPVFRHWSLESLQPGASVVARFSNQQPALIEATLGQGRVVTMSTPVSDRRNDPQAWNHLPTVDQPLPFFLLMQGLFSYLVDQNQSHWNYDVGAVVNLPLEGLSAETWQLFTPQGDWQNVRAEAVIEPEVTTVDAVRSGPRLTVASTPAAGTYRLKGLDQGLSAKGFSVNLPTVSTNLVRIPSSDMDEILGKDQYIVTRGLQELNRGVGEARVGRELYPFLILLVVVLVITEGLMSNRFYGVQAPSRQTSRATSSSPSSSPMEVP